MAKPGRKSAIQEMTRTSVIDRSWSFLNARLVDPSVSSDEKLRIALAIAQRSVPQEVEHRGEVGFALEQIHRVIGEYEKPDRIAEAARSICIN
jgi:hypothetical protein